MYTASKVLGKLQLTGFFLCLSRSIRERTRGETFPLSHVYLFKKTFNKVSENTLKADAYSVLWSIGGQETPCFVFQGTKISASVQMPS